MHQEIIGITTMSQHICYPLVEHTLSGNKAVEENSDYNIISRKIPSFVSNLRKFDQFSIIIRH